MGREPIRRPIRARLRYGRFLIRPCALSGTSLELPFAAGCIVALGIALVAEVLTPDAVVDVCASPAARRRLAAIHPLGGRGRSDRHRCIFDGCHARSREPAHVDAGRVGRSNYGGRRRDVRNCAGLAALVHSPPATNCRDSGDAFHAQWNRRI